MNNEIKEKFLTNTDETGRFIVTSSRTGRQYFVEPTLGRNRPPSWGDINPATGQVEGKYGKKFTGAIDPEESLITESNGFSKIHELEVGISPMAYIDMLDTKYPDKQ